MDPLVHVFFSLHSYFDQAHTVCRDSLNKIKLVNNIFNVIETHYELSRMDKHLHKNKNISYIFSTYLHIRCSEPAGTPQKTVIVPRSKPRIFRGLPALLAEDRMLELISFLESSCPQITHAWIQFGFKPIN